MKNMIDIRDIEHRAQRSFYQDGLLEVIVGLYLIIMSTMAENPIAVAFTPLLLFLYKPLMETTKRRFIYPRIGYVKFREEKIVDGKSFGRGILALAILAVASPFVAILIMGKGPGWEFWTRRFLPLFMGTITAIGPVAAAAKYRVKRWYTFAALCVATGLFVPYLGLESIYAQIGVEFTIIGGVAFITGAVMFLVFLMKHPVAKEEEIPA